MNTLEICNPITNEPGSIYPYTMEPRPARMSRGEIAQKANPTGIRVKVTKLGVVDDYSIRNPWPHSIEAVVNRTIIAVLFINGAMLPVAVSGCGDLARYTIQPGEVALKRNHLSLPPMLRGTLENPPPGGYPFDGQEFTFPLDDYYDDGTIRAAVTGSGTTLVEGFIFGSEQMVVKGVFATSLAAVRRNCGMNVQLEVEVLG